MDSCMMYLSCIPTDLLSLTPCLPLGLYTASHLSTYKDAHAYCYFDPLADKVHDECGHDRRSRTPGKARTLRNTSAAARARPVPVCCHTHTMLCIIQQQNCSVILRKALGGSGRRRCHSCPEICALQLQVPVYMCLPVSVSRVACVKRRTFMHNTYVCVHSRGI